MEFSALGPDNRRFARLVQRRYATGRRLLDGAVAFSNREILFEKLAAVAARFPKVDSGD